MDTRNCFKCKRNIPESAGEKYFSFDLQHGYEKRIFCSKECLEAWLKGKKTGMLTAVIIGIALFLYGMFSGDNIALALFALVFPYMLRQCQGMFKFADNGVLGEATLVAILVFGSATIIYPVYRFIKELIFFKNENARVKSLQWMEES